MLKICDVVAGRKLWVGMVGGKKCFDSSCRHQGRFVEWRRTTAVSSAVHSLVQPVAPELIPHRALVLVTGTGHWNSTSTTSQNIKHQSRNNLALLIASFNVEINFLRQLHRNISTPPSTCHLIIL